MGPEVDARDLKYKGQSDLSGEFFVEDVTPSNYIQPTRRLVFQGINPLIQTEALLKAGISIKSVKINLNALNISSNAVTQKKANNKKEKTTTPDYNSFLEDYASMIMAQLYSIKLEPGANIDSKTV